MEDEMTKAKAMGEPSETTEKPRDMGNTAQHVRDDGTILLENVIKNLELITQNKVNDEEGMERIAAECVSDLNVLVKSFMEVGAKVAPHYELENRIKKSRLLFTQVPA
jgi:hypothetical protein